MYQIEKQNWHNNPGQYIHIASKEENNNNIYLNDSFFSLANFPL